MRRVLLCIDCWYHSEKCGKLIKMIDLAAQGDNYFIIKYTI